MRARNIKPGFFKNEDLAELEPIDRLFFIGMWCAADREGRIIDRPKRIKMDILPCDNYDAEEAMNRLHQLGFIDRYEADGKRVIQIENFLKHQSPHGMEGDSQLPAKDGSYTVYERVGGYARAAKKQFSAPDIEVKKQSENSKDEGKKQSDNCSETVGLLSPYALDSLDSSIKSKAPSKSLALTRFDEFWVLYPRKVEKAEAKKVWAKLKLDTVADAVIAGAKRYAAEVSGKEPQYTKHATTWLNRRCWEDEPETPKAGMIKTPYGMMPEFMVTGRVV